MSTRFASAALAAFFVAAPAGAQEDERLRLTIEDCAERRIDADELAARLALELGRDRRAVVLEGPAPVRIEVRASCASTLVELSVARGERVVTRAADLGDADGIGHVWALALLAAELVRDAPALAPTPGPVHQASDDERPWAPRPESEARAWVGTGVAARLYLEVPTVLGGVELAFAYDWLRVAVAGLATEAGSALGVIRAGALLLEIGVQPLRGTYGALFVRAELCAAAGVTYGAAQPTAPEVHAGEAIDLLAGAGAALRVGWNVDPRLAVEAALAAGYDLVGPTYASGPQPVAALRGARIGITLALRGAP